MSLFSSIKTGMKKRTLSERIVFAIVWCIFCFVAISYLSIFVWCFMSGLKTHTQVNMYPFNMPTKLNFKNYIEVMNVLNVAGYSFWGMLGNSLYFSLLGPFITLMFTSMLAYVTTKYDFKGAKIYFYVVMISILLPVYGNTGAMYMLLYRLGFVNSYSQILLSFGGINIFYLYFVSTFKSLSGTYAEAAFLDGANDFQVYFKIMFPLVSNLFIALFIMSWQQNWNSYESALIYLDKLPTLASGLYLFEINMLYYARMDLLYAGYFISVIPPLVVYAFCNKLLTTSIAVGGIKE